MLRVISDPNEIRRFVVALRQFNSEVHTNTSRIRAQLRSLAGSWRDQEFYRLPQELETVISGFERHLRASESYIPELDRKAIILEGFLNK